MSPYKRRTEGNASRGDPGDHSQRGTTLKGQRDSGVHYTWRACSRLSVRTQSLVIRVAGMSSHRVNDEYQRCVRTSAQASVLGGRLDGAKVANRIREIRRSGMKTGASRNVATGAGLRPMTKAMDQPPDPEVRALEFYPDTSDEEQRRQRATEPARVAQLHCIAH